MQGFAFNFGLSSPKIAAIALMVCGALLFCLGGCSNTYASCKQSVIATDAAVITTTTLHSSGVITSAEAKPIAVAGHTLLAAESAWKLALDSGSSSAVSSASAAAEAALNQLLQQLAALQTTQNLALHPEEGRAQLTLLRSQKSEVRSQNSGKGKGKAKVGEVTAAIAIIELVADLTPQIVNWINAANANAAPTSADVQNSLNTLGTDLAALDAAIAQ